MSVFLAMLSTLAIGSGEFLAGDVTKRARPHEVTSTMFAAGVLMTAVVAIVWPGDPTSSDLVFGVLAGVTNGVAILLLYAAYSRGSLRSAAPAAAVVMSSVPIGWDVVVSGTSPTLVTWSGIVLGVIAIGFASYEPGESGGESRALVTAIIAGAVFGVLLILLGEIDEGAGGPPILLQRGVGFLVAITVTRLTGPRIFPTDRQVLAVSFTLGLFATLAVVLFVLALQAGGALAVVSVIGSQYAAVAVILAVVFRGQRTTRTQTVGLVLASLAVALIALG